MDDPFRLQDNLDRRHLAAGFVSAIPAIVLGSLADVLAGRRAIEGLTEAETELAVATILALRLGQPAEVVANLRRGTPICRRRAA